MDIEARIRRRRRRDADARLVLDYESLAPVTHVAEPVDRGPFLERLLDHLDPVFDGALPGNAYVWGPKGTGKSAVLTALVDRLRALPRGSESVIHTATRAEETTTPAFVYLDARRAGSEFGFYHALLDGLLEESVPEHGVGTETLRDRLREYLVDRDVVVVIDHVGEPATVDREAVLDLLDPLSGGVRWICVGREAPDAGGWAAAADASVEVAAYRPEVLVDVLMDRASTGLARRALDHAAARDVATWASGNAHDALAALFVAADAAATAGRSRIEPQDVEAGQADVPRDGAVLGRVLALPDTRRAVLRELVGLDEDDRRSVTSTAEAVAASGRVDLSASTVERFLYEMAEAGVLRREENREAGSQGRPPSRIVPRFSPTVFRRLYDLREP